MSVRGVAGLLAAGLLGSGCAALGLGEQRPNTYTVTADVEQAPNLFTGSRVTVRGVEVGELTDITPHRDFVRITMEIQEEIPIPEGAQASIVPVTLIADRYLQFHPAYTGGPTLDDGDHIPLPRTHIPAELDEVLTQLQQLLGAIEPRAGETEGPLARLITNLNAALDGHDDDLAGALERSATVLQNLATSDQHIVKLIRNLDRLFLALASRSSEIGLINQRFQLVARSLLRDQANLEGTVEDIAFLSEEATGLVSESGDDLGEAFARLARVMDELLTHQESLTLTMRWTNVIAQALGMTDSTGRGLYAYTGRQAEPGAPGAEYNYRIEQRDTISCERIDSVERALSVFAEPDPDKTIDTLFKYLADTYEDDLHFLLKNLVVYCADAFNGSESSSSSEEARPSAPQRRLLRRAVRTLGAERVERLIARWFFEGGL